MDSPASAIVRAKSEQIEITPTATRRSLSRAASAEALPTAGSVAVNNELNGGSGHLRKPSFGKRLMGSSPGRKSGAHHIRKPKNAQLKLDLEDVSSGAALSRASSASLGFSFSFTGFTALPEDIIADLKGFSDDENAVDPKTEGERKRIITEPTLPIYLKGLRKSSELVTSHELD